MATAPNTTASSKARAPDPPAGSTPWKTTASALVRRHAARRAAMRLTAGTLGVMLVVSLWAAPAAAIAITFDDLVSAGNPSVATVETSGYRAAGPRSSTIDTPGGGLTLRRLDGASLDLANGDDVTASAPSSDGRGDEASARARSRHPPIGDRLGNPVEFV
jgi:hypothetical protein